MRWLLAAALLIAGTADAHAEPIRLRADALGQAQAPTGVLSLSLSAEAAPAGWVDAEALIWTGTGELGEEADVLVVAVTLRDPEHRGHARLGRMIAALGALRPVHVDGVSGRYRFSSGTTIEAFGGLPVTPRFEERDYDWVAGARIGQSVGWATAGLAYLHRRDEGRLAEHEVGGDIAVLLHPSVDVAARATLDLVEVGFSEVLASLSVRPSRAWRFELRGVHRSPSRLLPATSLFSVLGDVPSQYVGARARWRAAPRLDFVVDGGARRFEEDQVEEDLRARGILRLNETGSSLFSVEASRRGAPDGEGWTGGRATVQLGLLDALSLALELELVRPDRPHARGAWWPWGLFALGFRPGASWEVAAAVEGSITPERARSLDVLLRAAYRWSGP